MAFERARERALRHGKWWKRQSFSASVGALVLLLGFLVYLALPLVLGTTMHGRTISCEKHISHSSRGGESTSYRCDIEMANGSHRTVTADTDYEYGQTLTYREWAGNAYVTADVVRLTVILGSIMLVFALVVAWAGIPPRTPRRGRREREPELSR
jgi:hypothetical protein